MAICGVVVGYSFDHDYRCGRLALATYTFIESIKLKLPLGLDPQLSFL
jgi:hypothetical protein